MVNSIGADLPAHSTLHRGSTREDVLSFKRRVPPRLAPVKQARTAADNGPSPPSMSDGLTSPEPFGKLLGDDDDVKPTVAMQATAPGPTPVFHEAQPMVAAQAQWQPGRRFSDQLPPSAFTQQAQSFEPRSAPAVYPTAFRARYSFGYTSTHTFTSPDPALYSPPTPLGDMSQVQNTHVFKAPTFSLNDASSWYSCGVAELNPPPPPPTFNSIEQPFDGNQEIFAMSPDGFQTHVPLAMSDGETCSPRSLLPPRGFAQTASQRRRDKHPIPTSQPYPPLPTRQPPSAWPSTIKQANTLLFTTDPLITPSNGPESRLRANSGATFMGASGFTTPSRPASAFGVASY